MGAAPQGLFTSGSQSPRSGERSPFGGQKLPGLSPRSSFKRAESKQKIVLDRVITMVRHPGRAATGAEQREAGS